MLAQLPTDAGSSCILLDVRIPRLSGPELQARLNDMGSHLPIVNEAGNCAVGHFITGRDEDVTRRAALSAGCVAYLRKPFSSKELLEAINISLGM